MRNNSDLKQIEKKLYCYFYQDGLLELITGLLIVTIFLGGIFEGAYLVGIYPALAFGIWKTVREKITLPRIGYAEFSAERKKRIQGEHRVFLIFLSVVLLIGAALFLFYSKSSNTGIPSNVLPFGFIIALALVILGYFKQIRRFFIFAALILLAVSIDHVFQHKNQYLFGFSGLILSVYGVVTLIRLILHRPIEKENINV